MASTYLTKTMGNPPGNSRIGTFSFWIKFSGLSTSADKYLFSTYENDNNRTICKFNTSGALEFQARSGGNLDLRYDTNRLFRDTNAWYNIVIATDTTQITAANRVKIYVNGVQETSFSTSTVPSQNVVPHYLYGGIVRTIGAYGNGNGSNFDGSMSYLAFIDGTQELPTVFGETDATTGEWKIKTTITPSSAFGDNGYLILKDGNSVTDQSGEGNNFAVGGGTLTKTEDCPDNVFATWNSISPTASNFTLSNGNTKIYRSGTVNPGQAIYGQTIMPTTGKWYVEAKIIDQPAGDTGRLGIANFESIPGDMIVTPQSSSPSTVNAVEVSFGTSGYVFFTINGTDTENSSAPGFSDGSIIMLAVDCDNGKFYVGSQGNWWNYSSSATGGDPTSGSGYVSNSSDLFNGSPICFHQGHSTGTSKTSSLEWNFGNGFFGTTSVSSAGTNASGIGIFEYDVPTGYTALSTKGLNL